MFTPEMKSRYDEDGFLVVESLFTPDDLAAVDQRTHELIQHPGRVPEGVSIGREGDTTADKSRHEAQNQTLRAFGFLARFDPIYREFAQHPKMLDIVRGLIGSRIKVFRDQMLLKPPDGQAKPMHQDQSYFRVQPENELVTAWIALDAATVENGCMEYVPQSHRHGIFPVVPDPERPVHHVPDTTPHKFPDAVACPVPTGSIIFHHGCTLHRSADNQTSSWRRALIYHFATSDSTSEREELNAQVTLEID